jgi:uncharacterized protein (DUF433 family)
LVKIDSRALVMIDAEILGGDPVFRGTGVPVHLIAAMLEQRATAADIVAAYPRVRPEMIKLAPASGLSAAPNATLAVGSSAAAAYPRTNFVNDTNKDSAVRPPLDPDGHCRGAWDLRRSRVSLVYSTKGPR